MVLIMTEYPHLNRSPFFNTFTNRRSGNVNQNRQHTLRQNTNRDAAEPRHLQHYALLRSLASHPQRPRQQGTSPQQPYIPRNIMPQDSQSNNFSEANEYREEHNPQQIAERIQQINSGLPDGVRFEPLDNETKVILQNMGKENSTHNNSHNENHNEPPAIAKPPVPNIPKNTPVKPNIPSNRGLPDGVRYEPIDEATMDILKNMGKSAPTNKTPSPSVPRTIDAPNLINSSPTRPAASEAKESTALPPSKSIELLEQLIQDESNASIYYQYLAGIAPNEIKEDLQNISKECNKWSSHHQQVLQKLHGRFYDPKDARINTEIGFSPGIEVAIIEERKILETMTELMDLLENNADSHSLQKLINRRMIRLNWLQWAIRISMVV